MHETPLRTTNPFEIDFKKKFDLTDKVVVITGACGLVGKAFCEAVAQFGGHVVVADIAASNPEVFAAVLEEKHKRKMRGFALDVSDKSEVEALKKFTLTYFNRIDGLVNAHQNKSHLKFVPFEQIQEENWDTVVQINLKGTFLTCQIIGSYMAEQGSGSIINIPSTYSVVAPNQNLYKGTSLGCPAEYSASKGGVDSLSRYLSSYWAAKGVRVNMITPHGVWNNHEAQFEANFAQFSPLQRLSYNHEVAGALIYLLSDASSYVTGDNLKVEGGWTVW
jgi:NAD(P)-dependent dehydrogenase (short-subunit alcohol dehydrogenase family)